MCAINPKHQKHFSLSVYTSVDMGDARFENEVARKLLGLEIMLNRDMEFRWHIKEREDGSEQ